MAEQRRGGHDDVRTREQVRRDVGGLVDPGRRGEGGGDVPAEDGDPGARQPRLAGRGQAHVGRDPERLRVDVGLEEPVEEHEAVRARPVEAHRHLPGRAEVRAQLDRHGHRHGVAHLLEDLDVPVLDLARARVRVTRDEVDVELDRRGPCVLHRTGEAHPATGRRAVEAGDDGHVDRERRLLEQPQVAGRPAGVGARGGREVGQRLPEHVLVRLGHHEVVELLAVHLLLEERVHDDRAHPRVGEGPHAVEASRQGRSAGHQRVAQREAEVARRQVHQRTLPSVANRSAPRVAISS